MTEAWPKIVRRTISTISPWVDLVTKDVKFGEISEPEVYHSLSGRDYVHIVAQTSDGRIPLVVQYRPAVERFTLELPSGLIDLNEKAVNAAARELFEETGFHPRSIYPIGCCSVDTGRMSNTVFSYFARIEKQSLDFAPELGISLRLVSCSELKDLILRDQFDAQAQIGSITQAMLTGYLQL